MTTYQPIPVSYDEAPAAEMRIVEGGVCAALGVRATGVHAGFRADPERLDLALVATDEPCVAAATFTKNRFCAAPVQVSRVHVADGRGQAVVLNSGNANAATGAQGREVAERTSQIVAQELGCDASDVLVCSTGVIGQQLDLAPFETGIPAAVASLEADAAGAARAARAVMTTDTVPKEIAVEIERDPSRGSSIHVGGFVKGSGMIMPNMATMLCVLSTDAPLTHEAAQQALSDAVGKTFNKVTVDSDTSTNDTCILFATGKTGGAPIDCDDEDYPLVASGVLEVCQVLAQKIAADGEGATKLVVVDVFGTVTNADADTVARSIANSPLVKTAIFGHDANWGRVAAAAGKCGVEFDQYDVDIDLLGVPVLRAGMPVPVDEDDMLKRFEGNEVRIVVDLGQGSCHARIWTCDLTHEYVTINGDYRT